MTACCRWCGRAFRPRSTGGSDQRFCTAACRNSFWSAGRRWIMRAVETGLLSVDVLKAAQSSLHAVSAGFPSRDSIEVRRSHRDLADTTRADTGDLIP